MPEGREKRYSGFSGPIVSGRLSDPGGSAEPAGETAVAPPVRSCPACGAGLSGRKRACGGRCRGALSKRRQAEALAAWLRDWAARASAALGIV